MNTSSYSQHDTFWPVEFLIWEVLLLDTGFAICYCKSINSGKGAQAKYRFVWAFLYPWIAAVGSILVLQDKGVLNH